MALPKPTPGLVISYRYLWRYEHEKGLGEGQKVRPCVVVLAVEQSEGKMLVTVAPVTHSAPAEAGEAIEIPQRVKQHLGLDSEKSWVVVGEVNQFTWPGFDLVPVPGKSSKYDYGFLPPQLYDQIKVAILDTFIKGRGSKTPRD